MYQLVLKKLLNLIQIKHQNLKTVHASLLPCSHICYHLKQRDCLNEETLSLFVDKDMYSIINCVKSLNKYLVKDQVSMTVQNKIEQQVIDIDDSDCQNIVPQQYTSLDLTPQELQLIQIYRKQTEYSYGRWNCFFLFTM
ncbi:Hypothetical_protein [Hexamita inflata]|uniref:Hypothetical_protein n=1 Tax=Hexamita inflata TaxID=28002 RepID=A0AA86NF50_9EUKA|nr:Hypothetical protein HINF_LOCUS5818 [Hexamita inflata]